LSQRPIQPIQWFPSEATSESKYSTDHLTKPVRPDRLSPVDCGLPKQLPCLLKPPLAAPKVWRTLHWSEARPAFPLVRDSPTHSMESRSIPARSLPPCSDHPRQAHLPFP